MATTFMNLNLPTVSVTLGPEWATSLNTAIETVDSHDHTSGKGTQIPTAGLNINANLDFNQFAIQNVNFHNMINRTTSSPSGSEFASSISVFSGNLYFTNSSGVAIQVTDGGGLVTPAGNAQVFQTQQVTSNLSINPGDSFVYLIVDTTASRTITLPAASAVTSGRIYIVKDSDGQSNTNNIILNAAGADTIDGSASQTFNSNYGSWTIVSNGSDEWHVS